MAALAMAFDLALVDPRVPVSRTTLGSRQSAPLLIRRSSVLPPDVLPRGRWHGPKRCSLGVHSQLRVPAPWGSPARVDSGKWSRIADNFLIGRCPRSGKEVKELKDATGVDAIICLQSSEDLHARGVSWDTLREAAFGAKVLTAQVPMREFDASGQAALLPEILAMLELLMGMGNTVLVCCGSGDLIAPLVALSYLTLSSGQGYDKAMQNLLRARPSSKPLKIAWDRMVNTLTEGTSQKQQEVAHREFKRRLLANEMGSHARDCQVALEQVASEVYTAKIAAQRALAKELIKLTKWKEEQNQQQGFLELQAALKVANARATKAEASAQASSERIKFFFRQLASLKEKEEASRAKAKALERSSAALARDLAETSRENERLRRSQAQQEEASRQTIERLRNAMQAKGTLPPEQLEQLKAMEASLAQAKERLRSSDEKNEFLVRQLSVSKESEQRAKAAARAADSRYAKVLRQVEDLAHREVLARKAATEALERFRAVNAELMDLGCTQEGPEAVQEIRVRLEDLSRQVAELKVREAAAEAATAEAMAKLADVVRKLERAEEKERETAASERAAVVRADELERRVGLVQEELAQAKLAAHNAGHMVQQLSEEVAQLREREAQADEAIRRYESLRSHVEDLEQRDSAYKAEIDAATERIAALGELISTLSRREEEMVEALEVANEKIQFLSERVGDLVQREEAARGAAESAEGRAAALSEQVGRLEEESESATRQAEAVRAALSELEGKEREAREAASAANSRVQELFSKVVELEGREQAAKDAAAEAYRKLEEMAQTMDLERQQQEAGDVTGAVPWSDALVFDRRELVPSPVQQGGQGRGQASSGSAVRPPGAQEPQQASADAVELEEKRRALGATLDECVALFVGQVSALKEREVASRDALTAANKRIEALSTQVSVLAKREEAANALAESFASQVTDLVTRIADLNEELEAAEQCEAELAQALSNSGASAAEGPAPNGSPVGQKRDNKVLVAELEEARKKADQLAAEVEEARKQAEEISENIFSARKRSLQEQQQREELVAEVVALKEAMVLMRERETAIAAWKRQLLEQADYLSSLMDEGAVSQQTMDQLYLAVDYIQSPN